MSKLFSFFLQRKQRDEPAAPQPPSREDWSASEWARVRAPARSRDAQLSAKARQWLDRLPDGVRPLQLSEHFPRITNQLAACWADVGLIDHLLQELLIDRRGDRQGFREEVVEEIALLYEYHDLRLQVSGDTPEPETPTHA